jgi:hypothetical protein
MNRLDGGENLTLGVAHERSNSVVGEGSASMLDGVNTVGLRSMAGTIPDD